MGETVRRRILDSAALGLLLASFALFFSYPLWNGWGPHLAAALAWVCLAVAMLGIALNKPVRRTGWRFASAAIGLGAAADTWLILIGRPGEYTYGPVLLGYVGCYVLGMVAFFWHLQTWTRAHYAVMALDGAILAVAMLTVLGSLALPGLVDPDVGWELKVAAVVFPCLDAILLGSLIRAITSGAAVDRAISITRVALFPLIAYHVVVVRSLGDYPRPNGWADELWVLCFVVMAVAVTRPQTGRVVLEYDPGEPTTAISEMQAVILAVSLVTTPVTILTYGLLGAPIPWVVIGAGGLLTALLSAVRIRALLREIDLRNRQVARLALTDPLTGIGNRRAWERQLTAALRTRPDRQLWVAMLDLDRFKDYNDSYGHQAGDDLLQEAARRWQAALPEGAVLARYGGEEFALLLRAPTTSGVTTLLERIRALTPLDQTCSVGVARWNETLNGDGLMAAADAALYLAKAAGRDRVVVAADLPADTPQQVPADEPRFRA